MSLSSDDMMKLMAYADGELEGDELAEAQRLLAANPDSVRFVEQLAGLGDIVSRGHEARSGKTIAAFDVADAVMALAKDAAKDVEKNPTNEGSNVSSLAAAREKRGNGLRIGVAVVAVLSLAASFFVFAQHRTDEAPMARGTAAPTAQPAASVAAVTTSPPATTVGGSGVSVSTVNSPGNSVSVFYLPTANELSTSVVVWVDETGEK